MSSSMTNTISKQNSSEDYDDRPLISDLLEQHSTAIKAVRDRIQEDPLYDSSRYDDIWILRFVLSHEKNTTNASKAALKTMKFRHERKLNELGDIRYRMPNNVVECKGEKYFDCHHVFEQYVERDFCVAALPDKDRGVIVYIKPGKLDQKKMAEEMSLEDLQDCYLYSNEIAYQIQDEVTRRTGRLTKQLKVIDLTDMQLRKIDLNFMRQDGAAAKLVEDYYPQLLGSVLVVNPPSWIKMMWNICRPMFPRRVLKKVDLVSPNGKNSRDVKPFLRYTSEENLPVMYGGKNKNRLACAGDLFEKDS